MENADGLVSPATGRPFGESTGHRKKKKKKNYSYVIPPDPPGRFSSTDTVGRPMGATGPRSYRGSTTAP